MISENLYKKSLKYSSVVNFTQLRVIIHLVNKRYSFALTNSFSIRKNECLWFSEYLADFKILKKIKF